MNGPLTRGSSRLLVPLLQRIRGGTLEVCGPDGTQTFGRADATEGRTPLHARVTIHHPDVARRLLRSGSIGLGQAYADGWWDTEDLTSVLRLAYRSVAPTHAIRDRFHRAVRPILDPIARRRPPDLARDRHNIQSHYDLGNELFAQLLDETMMYSSAVFETPGASLAQASRTKLDRLAAALDLSPQDHVLEIGTGWGGFAVYAASTYGCRVTTTTISTEQYEYARARVRAAGLDHLVTVLPDDYRTIDATFDKIVAIEMIEAVDWREYDTFFERCRAMLTDDGVVVLQAIVVPDRAFERTKRRTDFIKAAIFPGGCLPSVGALTTAANAHTMTLTHVQDYGIHYAETLRRWRSNLHQARDSLRAHGYDERFKRLWEFYFSYCEAGFDERYISVVQLRYSNRPQAAEHSFPARSMPTVEPMDSEARAAV